MLLGEVLAQEVSTELLASFIQEQKAKAQAQDEAQAGQPPQDPSTAVDPLVVFDLSKRFPRELWDEAIEFFSSA